MFERALEAKLSKIFDFKKVTFAAPGESQEQDVLFVNVQNAFNTIKSKKSKAKVTGQLVIYANSDKLPYGYFFKRINEADAADTKDLFFHGGEISKPVYENIDERTLSFVYFFNGQYNPDTGTITSVTLQESE